jgi:hypothetical protein
MLRAAPERAERWRERAACGAVLLALLGWRFFQVRDLDLPAWVDSVHHTLLVRLLLEQGRLPETWAPYLPGVPFYYHFGFHVTAALLARVAGWKGLALGRAVLVAGQLWQVVLAAGVYAVGRRVWRAPRHALTALVLVGFVSEMPGFYPSWGRYSLLAGLALLAWGMAAALAGRFVLLALLIAAVAVTHYYAFVLLLAFVALLALAAPSSLRWRLVAGSAAGLAASTPWLLRVWGCTTALARAPASGGDGAAAVRQAGVWELLGPDRNRLLLLVAAGGLALLAGRLVRQTTRERAWHGATSRHALTALVAWTGILCFLLFRQVGPFRPDHAAIVLFLPAVLLAAAALWELLGRTAAGAVLCLLAAWGCLETRHLARNTVLARPGDLAALAWVERATPATTTFLVDAEPWMGIWRGADGGWWITPLTGRRTIPPPVAYSWGEPELAELIVERARELQTIGDLARPDYCAELDRLMRETDASYYYTRSPRVAGCARLDPVYRGQGGLAIYARQGG